MGACVGLEVVEKSEACSIMRRCQKRSASPQVWVQGELKGHIAGHLNKEFSGGEGSSQQKWQDVCEKCFVWKQ